MRFSACRSKLNSPFMPPSRPTLTMRPRIAAASMFWLATLADTWSTIRSTPLPPVAALTLSGHAGSRVSNARSQPKSLSRSRRLSLVEVPMTIEAPICLAICMPKSPTPELAPWISTDSPFFSRPAPTTALCMVCSATAMQAACSNVMLLAGTLWARPESVTAYSAKLPAAELMTRSPGLKSLTSPPTASTSPAHSRPTMVPAPPTVPWRLPAAAARSARLSDAAFTLIRISCGLGAGFATSRISTPFSPTTAAFIAFLLLELETHDAHQPVGHLGKAFDAVAERDQDLRMVEVEEAAGAAGQHLGGDLLVHRLACGGIADAPRLLMQGVDLGIAIAVVVERPLADLGDERVAVGVGAAAPAEQVELVVAFLGLLDRGRELGDADFEVEARFRRHRLHDLGDRAVLRPVHHQEVERQGCLDAGLLEQRLGLGEIALGDRKALLIIEVLRADPLVAGNELAVEHHLVQRLAVDAELECLTHPRILAQRIVGLRSVAEIEHDAEEAERHRLPELELRRLAHRLDVGRQHALHDVEAARAQVREPHRAVDDRQVGDAVDEGAALVPVVGEALDDDAVLLHALDELVGAGAHRVQAELVAGRFGRLGRHHHAGPVGELGEQGRERRLEMERNGERIHHLDRIDRADVGLAERALQVEMTVEAVLGRRRVERFAVLELHAGPELDGHGLAVGRGRVAERQLRHDVELVVDVEQLVADRGEDDAPDIGAAERRIEHVGILGQPDAQIGLRAGTERGAAQQQQGQSRMAKQCDHESPTQTSVVLSAAKDLMAFQRACRL